MKDKKNNNSTKSLLNFIAEAGMLKQVSRSGWTVLGIKDPESVAEHSFRCAVLGYLLASLEKASSYRVLLMTLFGDMQEARITDLHKMAQKYINIKKPENKVFVQQIKNLPEPLKKELETMRREYNEQKTKESIISRDADILECLIQAKEYQEYGFKQASNFMKKAPFFLKTKSAKRLWFKAKTTKSTLWWFALSDFKRI